MNTILDAFIQRRFRRPLPSNTDQLAKLREFAENSYGRNLCTQFRRDIGLHRQQNGILSLQMNRFRRMDMNI